jgi:hypothetical protein
MVAERAERARHQSRIADFAGSDHRVEAFFDHIHQPVGEAEIQFDLRPGPHEGGERRHHQHPDQRQTDTKLTARRPLRLCKFQLCRLYLGEDASATLEE